MRCVTTPVAIATLAACWAAAVFAAPQAPSAAQPPTKEQLQFFESRIRPIFADNCYQCHSPSAGTPRGGLELDWKGGWEQGSNSGPVIIPGNPEQSLLIWAVRHEGVQMPPGRKLADQQINDLVAWVRMGAPDPRTTRPGGAAAAYGGSGKKHWAFQAVAKPAPPRVTNESWVANEIDRFVLAKLEASGMSGSERADKRTLIRRVYHDVIGLPPTPEQVSAFLADTSPNAFEKVIDSLLASPRYGERWARHWLDVARYSDTKGQFDRRRGDTPIYPYAWTYRDYVIKALNADLPYDQFIREQLAADRLEYKKNPASLAALGFLTLGDRYNGNAAEIINDRIDVTSKAFLGLTVTCARCHDHKFDPIPTADYYSLYGIFASSVEPAEKPVIAPQNAAYPDYLVRRRELDGRMTSTREQFIKELYGDYRRHAAVYLMATTMSPKEGASYASKNGADLALVANWTALTRGAFRAGTPIFAVWNTLARIPAARFEQQAGRLLGNLDRNERLEQIDPIVRDAFDGRSPRNLADAAAAYGRLFARTDAAWEATLSRVLDAALVRFLPRQSQAQLQALRQQSDLLELMDPGAPARAHILVDSPRPADAPILIRGQVETPGDTVPRRFLEVLSGSNRPRFRDGSGRLELANAIASRANPLTARVMVNRVWQHHFGEGFVTTPDDLGNQSAPPSHPELLDWLATRFMADGWSLKKLHKLILLSATWQQSSRNTPQFAAKDPYNRLLWRANIRRLEFEPLRDFILSVGGGLDTTTVGGHPVDLAGPTRQPPQGRGAGRGGRGSAAGLLPPDPRRTVYGYVDRADIAEVLNTFDFPSPNVSSGKRYETTVPQQALFLMNSPLVIEQVRRVVNRDAFQNAGSADERITYLYELFFQRPPRDEEIQAGAAFIEGFQPGTAAVQPAPAPAARGAGQGGRAQGPGRGRLGGAARGRGQPPPVRLPLSGWQEYAHALLLTNEAAFVN
jgi:mono/diheme cytochrome c family protein